jgi:hypothetical protein
MPSPADRIDLTYRDELVRGVIGARELRLPIEVPVSTGSARGEYGDAAAIDARWRIGSNYETVEQAAELDGALGDETIDLNATFSLRTKHDPGLVGGIVVGRLGSTAVTARVAPRGRDDRSVMIDGHWGDVAVAITAVAAVDRNNAGITGIVGGERIAILAERSRSDYGTIHIRGQAPGPIGLTLLMTVGLLYFL